MFYSSTGRLVSDSEDLYSRLSCSFHPKIEDVVLSQKKSWVGVCQRNSSKCHLIWICTLTCKTICAWSAYMQLQLHSHHWHWPLKNITSIKKRCIPGIGIGHSTLQHLTIRSYNSYNYCEKICIHRGELSAKCYQ